MKSRSVYNILFLIIGFGVFYFHDYRITISKKDDISSHPYLVAKFPVKRNLPPKYKLIRDKNLRYYWKDDNGYMTFASESNIDDAIESAWSWYEYEKRETNSQIYEEVKLDSLK